MKIRLSLFILFCLYSKPFLFYTQEGSFFNKEFIGSLSKSLDTLFTAEGPSLISAVVSCSNKCIGDRRCIGMEVCKIRGSLYQCRACCSWKKLGKEMSITSDESCNYFQLWNDRNTGYKNVALAKPTSMSSLYNNRHKPLYAVDGVVVCPIGKYYIAHTKWEQYPWLRIDLQQMHDIQSVLIYARQECCDGRLRNAMVTVSDDVKSKTCGFYPGPTKKGDRILVMCESHARGRFVTVISLSEPGDTSVIEVCEVQIQGKQL